MKFINFSLCAVFLSIFCLSDKEQFYGLIWSCCDENELPEAYFLANEKKYKVVWGKRPYLALK